MERRGHAPPAYARRNVGYFVCAPNLSTNFAYTLRVRGSHSVGEWHGIRALTPRGFHQPNLPVADT